jgi:glutaredoxin
MMRLIIRYFFKLVHAIVGPIMLAADWLTAPKGIVREAAAQQNIDARTKDLVMYQFKSCPFCIKTRRAIKRQSLNIEKRDALKDPVSRRELLEGGGKIKVPCLRIPNEHGQPTWLYESDAIISYLENRYA